MIAGVIRPRRGGLATSPRQILKDIIWRWGRTPPFGLSLLGDLPPCPRHLTPKLSKLCAGCHRANGLVVRHVVIAAHKVTEVALPLFHRRTQGRHFRCRAALLKSGCTRPTCTQRVGRRPPHARIVHTTSRQPGIFVCAPRHVGKELDRLVVARDDVVAALVHEHARRVIGTARAPHYAVAPGGRACFG